MSQPGQHDALPGLLEPANLAFAILEASADAVFAKDLEGRYVLVDAAGVRQFRRSRDEILGRDDFALFPPEFALRFQEQDRLVLESGETATFEDSRTQWGATRVWESTKSPLRDAGGAIVAILCVSRDVTRLKQAEQDLSERSAALREAQERLVHSERLAALGELSSIVAHEVRNPLGVIFNCVSLLQRQEREPKSAALHVIQEEAERLNRLVRDLLVFARTTPPDLKQELLAPVVETAIESALASTESARPLLRVDVPGTLALPMERGLLRHAILNLVHNALQAMPEGGTLTVAARLDASGWVELEVSDTGHGFEQGLALRIFEPFFTTRAMGTGLGLAVVRTVVEAHAGTVECTSSPGKGTTVRVRLKGHPP